MSINEAYKEQLSSLDDDELYQIALGIADKAYTIAAQLPDSEYSIQSQVQQHGLDVSARLAEALGSINPRDIEYYLGMARKDAFGLKNVINIATIREFPISAKEIAVQLDEFITKLDQRITETREEYKKTKKGKSE